MTFKIELNHPELLDLLDLANDMRREKKDELLEDLPKSIPANASQCLVARAFNYGCAVDPDTRMITFNNSQDRDTYLKVMGFTQSVVEAEDDYGYREYGMRDAPLTDELVAIAENFDSHIYEEYEEEPENDNK